MGSYSFNIILELWYISEDVCIEALKNKVILVFFSSYDKIGIMNMTISKSFSGHESSLTGKSFKYLLQIRFHLSILFCGR